MNMPITNEKRRYPRIPFEMPLRYKKQKDAEQVPIGTITRNISNGGACFVAKEFFTLATRLVLQINIPGKPHPVKAISKVAWISKDPSEGHFLIGTVFLGATKSDKSALNRYISNVYSVNN